MSNPYEPPAKKEKPSSNGSLNAKWWTAKRAVAAVFLATPLLLAWPVGHWTFHKAGTWLVSTDLEPGYRQDCLGGCYLMLMFCIFAFTMFPAFFLLWIDQVITELTGPLTLVSGLLLFPAALIGWVFVASYFEYG